MTDAVAELQAQLIELQTQLAFQEDTVAALDAVVTAQQRRIDQLTELCERLVRQVAQIAVAAPEPAAPDVPPHY